MKIFLTEQEVLELAIDRLDLIQPNPDRVHDIAAKMDMVYNEDIDLFEDVEQISLNNFLRRYNELRSQK